MSPTRLALLGSTGSIGRQTLSVAARAAEAVRVVALAAGSDLETLCAQARELAPVGVALERPGDPARARAALAAAAPRATVWVGSGAAERLVREIEADTVMNAIVGAAGLASSLAALERGERLLLANKETMVVGGPLVRARLAQNASEGRGTLIPVDSEHSAAMQCLAGRPPEEVLRLTITASGGALRDHPRWQDATPDQVLAHPVWSMGRRITVDSATLANKAFELIEARWLFDLDWPKLEAVLHPEALIHAWVTFRDGSSVFQAAPPDMALPIQLALSWPERWPAPIRGLGLEALQGLQFRPIPAGRYPAFDRLLEAGRAGGTAPCVANAADEVLVEAFLDGAIALGELPDRLARVLEAHRVEPVESLEQLLGIDAWARSAARAEVARA